MTEKNYNPQQKEKKAMKKQEVVEKVKKPEQPVEVPKKVEEKPVNALVEVAKKEEAGHTPLQNPEEKKSEVAKKEEKKAEAPKEEKKSPEKKEVKKVKKTEVSARGVNLPISTKDAKFICKFIVKKRLGDAIRDLEQVKVGRKAVPMKGEIPHRKGKGISSGRFPKKAAENFVIVLKSLAANANEGNLDEPIIVEAMANMAARPYGRFGRTQKKRTHVKIIAKDKMKKEKK
jgi:ribosomal protein L22